MIAGLHTRVKEIFEHRELFEGLHLLQIVRRRNVTLLFREEVRRIEAKLIADEHDPSRRILLLLRCPEVHRTQGERQGRAKFQEISSVRVAHL